MKTLKHNEIERLQNLARQVAEIAADPLQQKHIAIWKAANDRTSSRPALLARDYPIFVMRFEDELKTTIEDPFWKSIEQDLLLKIYEWKHLRTNRVVLPEILCHACVKDSLFGIDVSSSVDANEINEMSEELVSGSKHFDRIIDTEEDIERIQMPRVEYDETQTMERYARMREVFDGILEVKLYGIDFFRFVPWDDLLPWMNIERGMYDFVLNPDFMYKAMKRYVDCSIHRAKEYERLGLLSSNNTNAVVGAGGYGYSDTLPAPTANGIGARLHDNWGDVSDQILTSVSPDMTKEFAYDFETEWAKLFRYVYVGCCERLDHKAEALGTFNNMRKVSLSPFAKLEEGMEKLGKSAVVSFKPNSNYLTLNTPAYDLLEKELRDTIEFAEKYGCGVEIIMKTIITLRGEPQRLWKWCDMANEIVDSYYR